ncbi:MAG: CAP domain-containing protein [Candidatus Thiodiazotropha taylori]|nr:CAP domain-containing protein [Candidatus Thiodiazotropha taylori]MCG8105372.1 CAP domain-containing protein [Candidatus Thiodiazotropha taylori]MCG8113534.1 CAP domain-containing protein [Candidatus Thiodiazotropha taylori]MCW4277708.1 CAP domain-containing protein [Candidatus Thiodiazotropha taylori]MCW4285895.1 CAP domain-containing protein [Candidatus Thiodiazotropha taylori]
MKRPGSYLLMLAILIGLSGSSFWLQPAGDDRLNHPARFADHSPQDVIPTRNELLFNGRVARSYEEREVLAAEHEADRLSEDPVEAAELCEATPYQQEMLHLVNRARAGQRDCGGELHQTAPPLRWNCRLHEAAAIHSQDMIDADFFDHQGSDGSTVGMRVSRSGYEWRAVGENIAAGYPDNRAVMANLLSSPTHCSNIMDPKFREFGSAVIDTDQAHYYNYWTQVFGAR